MIYRLRWAHSKGHGGILDNRYPSLRAAMVKVRYFNGRLRRIRMWAEAATHSDNAMHYEECSDPATDTKFQCWPYDSRPGGRMYDC